jgi:hypothetical protein
MNLSTSRTRRVLAALAVVSLLGVGMLAGCSGTDGDDGSEASGGSSDPGGSAADVPAAGAREAADGVGSGGGSGSSGDVPAESPVVLQEAAIIKTGAIELESDDVGQVVTKVKGLVLTSGGRISSEDTATDAHGQEIRSQIELQVPVGRFEQVYEEIPTYATLVDTKQSAEDVTGRVADINSRVRSAQDSIDTLRQLFSQATKLGDVITLERELSQRQADLEALEAQQRSLSAQTTMSTILVSITQPDPDAATAPKDHDQAGFVAGIKAGWDGLVTFVVGLSHFLGLVLPIGSMLLLVGLGAWLVVRRLMPRRSRPAQPQPSE